MQFLLDLVGSALFLLVIFERVGHSLATDKSRVTIVSGGSTLQNGIWQVWKPVYQAYRSTYSDVTLTYYSIGSGAGIKRFDYGDLDFAASDEDLSEEQYANHTDYQLFPSFAVPISIAYNVPEISGSADTAGTVKSSSTGNLNLTRENVVGIFNGSIQWWNDTLLTTDNPRLADVPQRIIVTVRQDGSGTTSIFTRALAAFSKKWMYNRFLSFDQGCTPAGVPFKWNPSVNIHCAAQSRGTSSYILNTKYAIGYVGTSEARDTLLPDARLLNRAGNWVRPTVTTTQSAMESASTDLGGRLTGSLVDASGAHSYPIAGYTYILLRKTSMTNCTVAIELYRMFSYLLENELAQSVVSDMINVPLSATVLKQVKVQALSEMMCLGSRVPDLVALAISIEDGSHDAWKIPVMIVCALIGLTLFMLLVFYLYVKYTHNQSALRGTYVVDLNVVESGAKSAGLSELSLNSSYNSKMDLQTSQGESIIKVNSGERLLARKLCAHLHPESMQWAAKVMLVKFKDRMTHQNVLRLVGLYFHENRWKLINACPSKGRLQDVLQAGRFHLDSVFRYSILTDIAEGMAFLHRNGIVHGQLTSNSCFIDARWNVVVGDWEQYALHQAQKMQFVAFEDRYTEANSGNDITLRPGVSDNSGHKKSLQKSPQRNGHQNGQITRNLDRDINSYGEYLKCLYWSAPEAIIRDFNDIFVVSNPEKPADVYSYGVVAFEIFTDTMPFENYVEKDGITHPHHVLAAIKTDNLRPTIPVNFAVHAVKVVSLIQSTWKREETMRPTFVEVQKQLKSANPKQRSIIDSMMQAVENYATGLEERVAERTTELEKLTRNMETLLHSMLPASIADSLAKGQLVRPELFDSATLFFSDIVGFTTIAAASAPIDIVTLLNDLYSAFDGVIQQFDVYKVETIGDAYMCISGVPKRNGDDHVNQIASMSLDILVVVAKVRIRHMPERQLQVRIGVHSGEVVAGVVGITMPRYCLFGDTVNTASRMESSSLPMRIQISEATKNLLDKWKSYSIQSRGEMDVKGKGTMQTYWLVGKEGFTESLPEFDATQDQNLMALLDMNQIK